jgi:DME family drug/metabolite transporter
MIKQRAVASGGYGRGMALVVLGTICSSWLGLGVRMMEAATAWQILVYRSFGLALFLFAFIALRHPGRLVRLFRDGGWASIVGGAGLATAFSGSIVAMQQATVANAMFLLAAAPFLAAVLGRLVLKERVRRATWIAITCAFAGVALMVAEGISIGFLWGNVAGLAAALGLAVYVLALRWGQVRDMLPLNVIGGVIGTAVAAAVCMANGDGLVVSPHDTALGLAMGVFQLGIALIFITAGSKTVPAAELSLLLMIEVVLAPLWVWLVYGETVGFFTLLGGAIVLAAIAGDALTGLKGRANRQPVARGASNRPRKSI